MGKAIGNSVQGIVGIQEGIRKKRDAKALVAKAKQRQRNFEQIDLVNNAAMVKVSGEANRRALENINLGGAQAFEQAADVGIRGIGMLGKIQQNLNTNRAIETDRLAAEQGQVNRAAAQEQSNIQNIQFQDNIREQGRTDSMSERGQALRSQGAGEIGKGASVTGKAADQGFKDFMSFRSGNFKGMSGDGSGQSQGQGGGGGFQQLKGLFG